MSIRFMGLISFLIIFYVSMIICALGQGADIKVFPEVGYHPGGLAYWDTPFYADAMKTGGVWVEYQDGQWGSNIAYWNSPQFDPDGHPLYLNPGKKLRAIIYALHADYGQGGERPLHWPRRISLAQGHVVLEWKGDADIRLSSGGQFIASESSGSETGRLLNGKRVYRFSGGEYVQFIEVHDILSSAPITNINVWLSDPSDPQNKSLEGHLFHPVFIRRLQEADWGFIRMMNFLETNGNPQQDWQDRRKPSHLFASGTLNSRPPASGASGNRPTGAAYEHIITLCNQTQKDLWINIPHLATDDYISNLANIILFGSDGTTPYDTPTSSPVWKALDPNLLIYVEYSNEIWSNGHSFPQGDWAQEQATVFGITKPQFNARRFCDIWRIFQEKFGTSGRSRLINIAAIFTAADWYSEPFLREILAYGQTLSPTVEPDAIAITTYFGNGIQDWTYKKAADAARTDDQWFFTTETFDAGGGNIRPVSISATSQYWNSETIKRHLNETFDEWNKRLLSGNAREGAGPDAVGIGGGFDIWVRNLAQTVFSSPKPIIAYEGGPSIYTDNLDWGDPRDDGNTIFMDALNRHPRMAEVYRIHLNMAKSKGLRTHVMFTDSSKWGKYGQWGHLEYLDQPNSQAVKYQFMLDWINEAKQLRHIDEPLNKVPKFDTEHNLPFATVGQNYSTEIKTSDGDGTLTLELIGANLPDGLQVEISPYPLSSAKILGVPLSSDTGYIYLRVHDSDGDAAWRTFTLKSIGGAGVLVESDFTGKNPAQNMSWKKVYFIVPNLSYDGWSAGSGIRTREGDNAIVWAVDAPGSEEQSTLLLAIADNEFLSVAVAPPEGGNLNLRNREVLILLRRIDWHSPRRYAVFTNIGGFSDGKQVFNSERVQHSDDLEIRFNLPDAAEYENISNKFEIRIVGYSGQWGGHKTSLLGFRLNGIFQNPPAENANAIIMH